MSHDSIVSLWSNTSTTLGSCGLVAVIAQGSSDQTTLTLKDGTATKYVPIIATTSLAGFIFADKPVAFRNLIVTCSGTGSYSITYQVRPR